VIHTARRSTQNRLRITPMRPGFSLPMPGQHADARPRIPIIPAELVTTSTCTGAESFALMVLGDSMAPEFNQGDVVIIEPDGLATDGSYVLALWQGELIFRRLGRRDDAWHLQAVNPNYPDIALPDLQPIRGVITQKSRPGRRRATKHYVA
jgi:SOS-response transcriptional repressor LexA